MKKSFLVLLVAAIAFAAAGTGGASTQSPQAAGRALLTCGKTRTIGLLAPITGPAASIGGFQVKRGGVFLRTHQKAPKTKIKPMKADTPLRGANRNAPGRKKAHRM